MLVKIMLIPGNLIHHKETTPSKTFIFQTLFMPTPGSNESTCKSSESLGRGLTSSYM